jgi:hypothetical protein
MGRRRNIREREREERAQLVEIPREETLRVSVYIQQQQHLVR